MTKTISAGLLIALSLAPVTAFAEEDLEALLSGGGVAVAGAKSNAAAGIIRSILNANGSLGTPQAVFVRAVEKGNWEEALITYAPAMQNTQFQGTDNAIAVKGYLQYQAGLPLTGIETLFTAVKPESIDRELIKQWIEIAPAKTEAWEFARVAWTPAWSQVFPLEYEVRVRSALMDGKTDIESLRQLALIAPDGSLERGRLQWKLVVALSLTDKADEAAKLLAQLMKAKNPPVSKELMDLTAARLLYQRAYFDAAVKYNEKIGKGTDLWTQAQEEMAWAYVRKGQPQNALATTKTLLHDMFATEVGVETYFLTGLAQLKVCDYKAVLETLKSVSPRFKERTLVLEKLGTVAQGPAVNALFKHLRTKEATTNRLGRHLNDLPRFIHRDERLQQLVRAEVMLENEAKQAAVIYGKTLALTGLQGEYEKLSKDLEARVKTANGSSTARVQEMARREVDHTRQLVQKMHILEAEVIQQVASAEKIAKGAGKEARELKGTTGSKALASLRFPVENEVWIDEMSNYKVDIRKGCQVIR